MTTKELYHTAYHNLLKIHESASESLRMRDFTNQAGAKLRDPAELIEFLKQQDLIEIEDEADTFYLTTETYDLIENKSLDVHLMDLLNIEEEFNEEKRESRGLSYELIGSEENEPKTPFLGTSSRLVISFAFLAILWIIYYFIPLQPPHAQEKQISPEEIEGLDNVLIIQDGDTLDIGEKKELLDGPQ